MYESAELLFAHYRRHGTGQIEHALDVGAQQRNPDSSGESSNRASGEGGPPKRAALLTSTSTRPVQSAAAATTERADSADPRLYCTTSAWPPAASTRLATSSASSRAR